MRIDGHRMNAHFIVEVGAGGASRLTDVADDLAAGDVLAGNHDHGGEMSIDGMHVVTVVDDDLTAVTVLHGSAYNKSIGGGAHRRAIRSGDIDAGVEGAFPVDRIIALAEAGGYAAFKRPEGRGISKHVQIAAERGSEATLKGAAKTTGHGLGAESIKLIERLFDVLLIDVIGQGEGLRCGRGGGGGFGRASGPGSDEAILAEAVEGGNFTGKGAE